MGINYNNTHYVHTWQYMEREWEELDRRVSLDNTGAELDEGISPSGGLERPSSQTNVGGVLGETQVFEGPDNLHQGRQKNGR